VVAPGRAPASSGSVPELSWSPDGRRLLVSVGRAKDNGSRQVAIGWLDRYHASWTGTPPFKLTTGLGAAAWS
jgi:hypothetical protein